MKLLSFTICCLILKVRSQFLFQQSDNQNYAEIDTNRDKIFFRDETIRNQFDTRQLTTQNGNTQNRQAAEQQAIASQSSQQFATPVSNPANFNTWTNPSVQKPVNQNVQNSWNDPNVQNQANRNVWSKVSNSGISVQDYRNRNDLNRFNDQTAINQNLATPNQNPGELNQASLSTQNENLATGQLDESIFEIPIDNPPFSNVENEAQVPNNQETEGISGVPQEGNTINFVKPKIDKIGRSVTNFGLNVLKSFSRLYDGNIVISPLSIASCLALLQQGARDMTESEISNALQLSPESSRIAYKSLADDIKKRSSSSNILRTANNIYMAKNFQFNTNFSRIALTEFGSEVSTLDYSQPESAAEQVNAWVATKTNNKITHLVTPQHVGPTTQMMLVNAVYFKGLWEVPFNAARTKPREFNLRNGKMKKVQFMRSRRNLRGAIDPVSDAHIIIIPFQNEEYSLMWILPSKESNLNELINSLTVDQVLEFMEYPSQEFDFEVPKFTMKTDSNLIPILRQMGVSSMFGPYADLSGLGGNQYHNSRLSVSSAIHSAVLSIDEQGGSAAAATSFGVVALANNPAVKFRADRPYSVILWDNASATPLIMAKIMDPSDS